MSVLDHLADSGRLVSMAARPPRKRYHVAAVSMQPLPNGLYEVAVVRQDRWFTNDKRRAYVVPEYRARRRFDQYWRAARTVWGLSPTGYYHYITGAGITILAQAYRGRVDIERAPDDISV